jgi:haloalkane dehalogenase
MNEDWLDRRSYPFTSHYFDLPMGRMHYVDEGSGPHTLVMVHGNPVWSYAYRHLIGGLSRSCRCIAMDHIGFGLSDKPSDWDYLPQSHARNLETLLDHLQADNVTLVVGDWGGPIGLSYAIRHPQRIRSLVISNTWMWPVNGVFHYEAFSRLMGGPVGRLLIRRYNFFVNVLMRSMFRARLDPQVHRHYEMPLRIPEERKGCWTFPGQIIGSGEWLRSLWEQREKLTDKPALILWGMRDIAFRDIELRQWQSLFPSAEVHAFEQVGHFVPEAMGASLCPIVEAHLHRLGE